MGPISSSSFNFQIVKALGIRVESYYEIQHLGFDGTSIMEMPIDAHIFQNIKDGRIYMWIGGVTEEKSANLFLVRVGRPDEDVKFEEIDNAAVQLMSDDEGYHYLGINLDMGGDPTIFLPLEYPTINDMEAAHEEQQRDKAEEVEEVESKKRKIKELETDVHNLQSELLNAVANIKKIKENRMVVEKIRGPVIDLTDEESKDESKEA
jgi:hypothetical protein